MNIFDVIGPVMVGPSSSHTAGAVKDGPYEYPNREWGYGKINIYNTLLEQRF